MNIKIKYSIPCCILGKKLLERIATSPLLSFAITAPLCSLVPSEILFLPCNSDIFVRINVFCAYHPSSSHKNNGY